MALKHTTTEDRVWQRAARAAIGGNVKAIAWLDRRGWSVEQAKRFLAELTDAAAASDGRRRHTNQEYGDA